MRSGFIQKKLLVSILAIAALVMFPLSTSSLQAAETKGKVKVLYHVDGKDLEVAKYALALINKHIDAEGGHDARAPTEVEPVRAERLETAILDISGREQRRIGQDLHDGRRVETPHEER